MAPEQWIGADVVGPEADIYALGVVAYQTLTGRLPFVADRTDEYFELHRRAPVPRLGDSFPPDLDPAIRCALDKYPRARHSSALELAKDLRRVLRAGVREQLRASAQQWSDQAWAPGLLWGADVLEDALRSAPRETLSQLECSFVAESQRRIRRTRWVRRSLAALAAAVAIGGFLYDAAMQTRQATLQTQLAQEQTRSAQEVAAATVTQAELEQGRAALLHCEPDAWLGLGRAYQRGDRSPSTAFMLARALQPRLAERARFTSTIVALSSDGKLVAAIGAKGDVAHVWDAITGALVAEIRNDGPDSSGLAFSPDGRWLATTGGSDVLMLRSQTLRVLANTDLSRAIGGDSGARCPAVVDSGDVACPTTFAAVTTANCR
jgi:hypothetical protein